MWRYADLHVYSFAIFYDRLISYLGYQFNGLIGIAIATLIVWQAEKRNSFVLSVSYWIIKTVYSMR